MKKFRLTYNGKVSEFNATYTGRVNTELGYTYIYSVRSSKTNKLDVNKLFEEHHNDGTVVYHFNCKKSVQRGLEVKVEVL